MPLIQGLQKLKCDGKKEKGDCPNELTFSPQNAQEAEELAKIHPWLLTGRIVQLGGGRNFFYCCDLCEVSGIEAGNHNPVKKPSIENITGSVEAQIAEAAAKAKAMNSVSEDMKKGKPLIIK